MGKKLINISSIHFGKRIKALAELSGMTNMEIIKLLGDTEQNYYAILKKKDVSTAVLRKFCGIFNIEMEVFFKTSTRAHKSNSLMRQNRQNVKTIK